MAVREAKASLGVVSLTNVGLCLQEVRVRETRRHVSNKVKCTRIVRCVRRCGAQGRGVGHNQAL